MWGILKGLLFSAQRECSNETTSKNLVWAQGRLSKVYTGPLL